MKILFKRYLEFEKKYGDDEKIEGVKRKAVDYVQSKAAVPWYFSRHMYVFSIHIFVYIITFICSHLGA